MEVYCDVIDEFGCQAFESFVEDQDESTSNSLWLRLENDVDPTLVDIVDCPAALSKIDQVRKLQAKSTKSDLYIREWYTLTKNSSLVVNGDLLAVQTSSNSFTIAQFNTLAEGLSTALDAKRPFSVADDVRASMSEKNPGFGGFLSVPFKEVALDFSLRRWRLLEVLLTSYRPDTDLFDIIALEEVDRYHSFFSPMLRLFGYQSFFAPKTRSPCLPLGWYSDGCALFWRRNKFELLSARRHEYKVGSQVYILAILRHLTTDRQVVVVVTHLKAQSSDANEKVRCAQVDELLSRVSVCVSELSATDNETSAVPILLVGDFNADAQRQFMESCIADHVLGGDLHKGKGKMLSAYPVTPPSSSMYTTWKIRGNKETKRTIDYIFYSGDLDCISILQVPDEEDLEATRLPGLRYPSDHLLIAAEFIIR